ncbi:hypothetical protein BC628DRAFT_1338005 [Trametes gibbosa]|nr:hypothetical protein BC628DRAFT_1338005 [Trametes gibbosa]
MRTLRNSPVLTAPASPISCKPPPANTDVVLGVISSCALVAFAVAILVPLVRCRAEAILTVNGSLYRKVLDGDVEGGADADANGGGVGLYLPSRRSSFRHQKVFAGPDTQPSLILLLYPLQPISALTWPDLHSRARSSRASIGCNSLAMADEDDYADSDDATGGAAQPDRASSLSTNRATTSHRSRSTHSEHERGFRRDELGRPVISDATNAATRRALPLPPRSPTPPGLPSKREVSARRASLPLPITPTSSSDAIQTRATSSGMPSYASIPSTSLASQAGMALTGYSSSRHRPTTQKPGMEPVLEDSMADVYAETRSLQLPSPPASPEQPQPYPHWRGASHLSSSSLSNAPSSSSSNRRRPSLTASQSAPSANMPYRPRSSTGPAIPLTAAFQTSVLRSGSQSTAAGHRYPSIVTSPLSLPPPSSLTSATPRDPSSRVRPSSVSVAISSSSAGVGGLLSPESPEMTRPSDTFRRMSTTDIRHRRPSHASFGAEQDRRGEDKPQAFSPTADVARTMQVQSGIAYNPRAASMNMGGPPPHPLSPHALGPTPPRLSVHTRGQSMASPTATRRGSTSSSALSPQQQQQQGPALVRRKDSTALRPIPVSALMGPPSAGMAAMSLGQGGGSRSRSNSVRSTRMGTSAMQLPPLDPATPLTLSTRSPSEEEELEEGYLR